MIRVRCREIGCMGNETFKFALGNVISVRCREIGCMGYKTVGLASGNMIRVKRYYDNIGN